MRGVLSESLVRGSDTARAGAVQGSSRAAGLHHVERGHGAAAEAGMVDHPGWVRCWTPQPMRAPSWVGHRQDRPARSRAHPGRE